MHLKPYLDLALEAAKAGEQVIRHYYNQQVEVSLKADDSPVTIADVETEQTIKKIITAAYPQHGFYGEETGQSNIQAEYLWLIDPIDGTKSFVREYPFFSTQIALMHRGEIIVGVSNAVMFNECAWASKGDGAFLNGESIRVSDIDELRRASLSTGNIASMATNTEAWMGLGKLAQQVNRTRGYGDFYHYHLLASGKIELVVESDLNILDIAALSLIVSEAGGIMTDLKGQSLDLQTSSILASNSRTMHGDVMQMINKAGDF